MIVIILISLALYLVSITCIYKTMPEIKKEKKIKYILVGCITIFIITFIVSNVISIETQETNIQKIAVARRTAAYILSPINSIILMLIGISTNKYKSKRISKEKLNKRLIIYLVVFIVLMFLEKGYMKGFIEGLLIAK